ncbi:MAG: transporter ATP-binding protein [Gammaproteobacteria bacterium]|jgi:NitT/TauT family transport system ATP-binding protein|nr:transporter ATP-binding protein [Gammaproteobacteria bacterium]
MTETTTTLIKVRRVSKSFKKGEEQSLLVLDDLNLSLKSGEIVALLGKSGSGKSTLLRIIAGLVSPSKGQVTYQGNPITGPIQGLSMVFQSFALFPWLTVLQNVELGLEAQGIPPSERRTRALKAIDIIGLDGFESAYPKELSGGMRQRVGFARALVVDPHVMLMDEPFSALDPLTAEDLRNDLLGLWQDKKTNIQSILIVTHNIEEAAILADRIIVFSSNPGKIRGEIKVDLPRPRNTEDDKFRGIIDDIYTLMTASSKPHLGLGGERVKLIEQIGYRLPKVEVSQLTGFLDTLNSPDYQQKIDLPELADDLSLDVNELFLLTEALEILHFAHVSKGDIELTAAGRTFSNADMLKKKEIFASHLIQYIPLARHIKRVLDERPGHRASENRFLTELEDQLSEEAASEVLEIIIDWGRYAELFAYDYNAGVLSLENPE